MKNNLIIGGVSVDDRGSVRFVNDFDFNEVKRFYQVDNHRQGFIRAWHGHLHEGKYAYVAKGSALVGAVEMDSPDDLSHYPTHGEVSKHILSSQSPKVLWIPPGYANGFMTLTEDAIIQFFSTSSLKESLDDDIRFPYDKWDIWNTEYR
jgi:dTDP-4-dehydrorhamnose 3,5-epimerase